MAESPLMILTRWEDEGGVWRAKHLADAEAVVELCSCSGEPVEELRSTDRALISYLERRPRSDPE